MNQIKNAIDTVHDWIGRQRVIVQVGILFVAAFAVIACLMAAFT